MACQLLGGYFAYFLQMMVAVLAFLVLVYKRSVEPAPRRSYRDWCLDISKQGWSSLVIHSWNVFSAMLFTRLDSAARTEYGDAIGDECAFYVINYALDTCFGIFLIWSFLLAAARIAHHMKLPSLQSQGWYGTSAVYTWYFHQTLVFLLAIMLSKTILSSIELMWSASLSRVSSWLFRQFDFSDNVELILALIVLPFFMSMIQVPMLVLQSLSCYLCHFSAVIFNAMCLWSCLQYWIQDNILMGQSRSGSFRYQEIGINMQTRADSTDEQF